MAKANRPKELCFAGSSLSDLRKFPEDVRQDIGYALYQVQLGFKPIQAKPLKGFGGAAVLEIIKSFDGGAYRAVYTVRYPLAAYVLHCFQKNRSTGLKQRKRIGG